VKKCVNPECGVPLADEAEVCGNCSTKQGLPSGKEEKPSSPKGDKAVAVGEEPRATVVKAESFGIINFYVGGRDAGRGGQGRGAAPVSGEAPRPEGIHAPLALPSGLIPLALFAAIVGCSLLLAAFLLYWVDPHKAYISNTLVWWAAALLVVAALGALVTPATLLNGGLFFNILLTLLFLVLFGLSPVSSEGRIIFQGGLLISVITLLGLSLGLSLVSVLRR
jgi:hypothetical protein